MLLLVYMRTSQDLCDRIYGSGKSGAIDIGIFLEALGYITSRDHDTILLTS